MADVSPGGYDADVIVVGAGPAGLAAATRVRWVKGYHAMACSVRVIESGTVGGLLRWGSCVLSGPGWAYKGQELTDRLMVDIERLRIPIQHDQVVSIHRKGALLEVGLASGAALRSLAVILATGFRPLANESEYYLRGVRITYKGYEHFPRLLRACAKDASGRGLLVVGNEKTSHLKAMLRAHTGGAGPVTVLDGGELLEVMGETHVVAAKIRDAHGERIIDCGAILMDYNAFELTPALHVAGVEPARDSRGFLTTDGLMRTSEPGVFAAGDVTGRYASTLVALGDGVAAGLSAYAYAFERKFNHAPRLFAYAADDEVLPVKPIDLPVLPSDCVPLILTKGPSWVDGCTTLEAHALDTGRSLDDIRGELMPFITSKAITVHRRPLE
ncbi:MAG: FAD-dependent oxidoreductase [Myxococcota bacterium]|nr:FAD-dependent oxidoreductase [Myxococcota bacterium]